MNPKEPGETVLEVLPDREALARRVAEWLLQAALAKDGVFAIALSGGSTPRRLYERLAEPPFRDTFPWRSTHWFWGDERFVAWDDCRSNYRMVHDALLAHAPIPPTHVHPIPTQNPTAGAAALAYERTLKAFYGADELDPERPLFDVTLLGLGHDGHTASLFPNSAALEERARWVAAVVGARPEARITLSYPALESSRRAAFLVSGPDKRAILERARHGEPALPAARFRPVGTLHWFADAAAAGPSTPGAS